MQTINLPGGWIYVLFSSSDYSRCKIGKTDGNPLARFRQLRTGDPFLALHVAYYIPAHLGPVRGLELHIHHELNDCRIKNHEDSPSEWFSIEMYEAEKEIDYMLGNWFNKPISRSSNICLELLTKMYGSEIQDFFNPDPHDLEFARYLASK